MLASISKRFSMFLQTCNLNALTSKMMHSQPPSSHIRPQLNTVVIKLHPLRIKSTNVIFSASGTIYVKNTVCFIFSYHRGSTGLKKHPVYKTHKHIRIENHTSSPHTEITPNSLLNKNMCFKIHDTRYQLSEMNLSHFGLSCDPRSEPSLQTGPIICGWNTQTATTSSVCYFNTLGNEYTFWHKDTHTHIGDPRI